MKKFYVFIVLAVLSIYLIGCSSSSDDGDGNTATAGDAGTGGDTSNGSGADEEPGTSDGAASSTVTQLGFVVVDEELSGSDVYLYAIFTQLNESAPNNLAQEGFRPQLDVCNVTEFGLSPSDNTPDLDDVETEFSTISAGETILFTSSAGTFSELQRKIESGNTFYEPNTDPVAGPLPDGLIIDIPGDVFPAFSNVAVPNLDAFELKSPASGEVITPASVFTWEASNNPDSVVEISASNVDFSTSKGVVVSCVVTDDGSFGFPTKTQAEMGADFSSILELRAIRYVFTIKQQGEAILVVTSTSGE